MKLDHPAPDINNTETDEQLPFLIYKTSISAYPNLEKYSLTLSDMGQGIFIPLSLLDQILSADFFFKNFQTLLEVKIEINQVILTPCPAH